MLRLAEETKHKATGLSLRQLTIQHIAILDALELLQLDMMLEILFMNKDIV